MDNIEKVVEELRGEIRMLREECGRNCDRQLIENLVARYQYYYAAGLGERIVDELWAREVPTVSNEFGASGVYRGIRKVKTYYQKDIVPGRFNMHTMTTPAIEIAGDRKTAKGVWMSIGVETDAGDLGPEPVAGYEQRLLLSSVTTDGKRFKAEWIWQKFEIEFIRETAGWKIWHLHAYDVFRCPYDESWVTYAEKRFRTDGLGIEAIYTKNVPYGPDEPPENNADVPTTTHWQYTVDAVPVLAPEPPEPYETMDTSYTWPMMP